MPVQNFFFLTAAQATTGRAFTGRWAAIEPRLVEIGANAGKYVVTDDIMGSSMYPAAAKTFLTARGFTATDSATLFNAPTPV